MEDYQIKYLINIICHEDGWILNKFGKILSQKLENCTLWYPKEYNKIREAGVLDNDNTINYYINYSLYRYRSKALDVAFMTHIEMDPENLQLRHFYMKVAAAVDLAVFMAPVYQRLCSDITKKSCLIIPGIDETYICKLNLGIVGRAYSYTSRKNPELLAKLHELEWVNIEFSGGDLSDADLLKFYERQDYILVLSKVEAGPMCVIEALALGKEVIFPQGVGFGELFADGLWQYDLARMQSLIDLLHKLFSFKKSRADLVRDLTWDNFVLQHVKQFDSLHSEFKKS